MLNMKVCLWRKIDTQPRSRLMITQTCVVLNPCNSSLVMAGLILCLLGALLNQNVCYGFFGPQKWLHGEHLDVSPKAHFSYRGRVQSSKEVIINYKRELHSVPRCEAVCLIHMDLHKADCFLPFMEKQLCEKLLLPALCLYNVLVESCCIAVTGV